MRKLLLFLLLLGAGLLLLYWFDQRGQTKKPDPPAVEEPAPVAPDPESQGFQLGGPSQLTRYDDETKRLLYRVKSEDTRTENGVDVLTGVTLEVFDPAVEDGLQLRLRAERARPRRAPSVGLQPSWEDRLELEGVQAEVLAGIPLAPLTFETASAVIDLADRKARIVTGEEAFSARAPEMTVAGRGFEWRIDQNELLIRRAGRIELLRPGAAPATLSAIGDGPLRAFRAEGPEGPLTLEASAGAVLEPGGESPGRLEARHVTLRARAAPGGAAGDPSGANDELLIERLDATGDVDWTSGDARFQGQRLVASFLSDGRVEHARLDGEPRAELALSLSSAVLAPPDERARDEETPTERLIVLEGQDALDITWKDGGYELHMEGQPAVPGGPPPARVPSVVTRDFRLQSAGTIDGWLSEDQRSARFEAGGGVLVTSGTATLETAVFALAIGPDPDGQTLLVGTASGGARLVGELATAPGDTTPARGFTLASPDGLTIERSVRGWRVVESTRVEVSLDGPDGFRARADRVRDFLVPHTGTGALAPEGLRFAANGAVEVEFGSGRIGGEELEVLGVAPVRHFVVRGPSESKAYLSTEYGEASALEVEITGDTLEARGEVTGSADFTSGAEQDEVRTTFAGDQLTLDLSETAELLPGERLRILRVVVDGNVQCSVTAEDQTLVVKSARFSAENRARLVEGADAPIELGSLFIAEGDVHADFVAADSDLSVDCERFEVERTASDLESGFRELVANGNVRFQGRFGGREQIDAAGECEILVFDADRHGSMQAGPHGRVTLAGRAPEGNTPYRLTAERVDFELSTEKVLRVLALRPELRMLGLRAHAEHFTADDQSGVVLSGAVRVGGATSAHVPYTLEAEEVVVVGRRAASASRAEGASSGASAESSEDQIDAMHASGDVDFRLSEGLRARGERLVVRRANGLLRFEGLPASIEFGPTRYETEWVEFDPVLQVLVATGPGRVFSTLAATDGDDSWTLDFLSASTLLELDSVVLVIQEPVFRTAQFQSALRASWAILWLNRECFQDADKREELMQRLQASFDQLKLMPEGTPPLDKLTILRTAALGDLLRELYFEGPVEVLADGELLARADAMYLDVASQHGWLAHATVNMGGQFLGQRHEKLIVKADWLRLSGDASLRADSATVTSCNYDDPHVRVVTGDLKIEPTTGLGKEHYQLLLRDNRIELYDKLRIPLPTIEFAADDELKPLLPTLSLANSARFGTLFGFAFTRPADRVGRVFDSIARPDDASGAAPPTVPDAPAQLPPKPRSDVDANYKVDGSYLGSRGGLLDLGLEIEAKEDYWFDLYTGIVLDSGDDRGFVRVDEDERDSLRLWLRSQAYFDRGKNVWSFSYSDQSDAGVQSEFFEGQFLRYERSETYVQWRRTSEENFVQASAKVRVDGFRSDVEELPSFSGYRGRSPLLAFGPLSLIHTGDLSLEYLRRRTGSEPHSPFELGPTFKDVDSDFGNLDGLGDREVLRLDTTQALELPVPLGAGWKLTPFLSGRASAWSEDIEEQDEPTRLLAEGGARLGATYWKRTGSGKLHQFAPFVEYRAELEREDEGGTPVEFDARDRLLSGDFFSLGTRARFAADGQESMLDVDLVGTHASDRSDGQPDGWLPLAIFGRLLLEPAGQEFEIFHDARYDLEEKRTVYSLVSLGTHFGEEWGVQFAHQRGLDTDYEPLFESASVSGLYRWTEKWEFEASESFSLLEDEELDTKFLVRRYGHDIVFEFETSYREGEGSSFGVSVKPRFGYRPPRVGYVPW